MGRTSAEIVAEAADRRRDLQAAALIHDGKPVTVKADIPAELAACHLGELERADSMMMHGNRRQRDQGRALVRRIKRLRAEAVLRAEVKAGVQETSLLDERRGIDTVEVGGVHLRFTRRDFGPVDDEGVHPRLRRHDTERHGLLSLWRRGKVSDQEAMAGVVYAGLWHRDAPGMRSSVAEIVSTAGGRPDCQFDMMADNAEAEALLRSIEQAMIEFDEEGEVSHLMHWVARDGHAMRQASGGGREFDRAVSCLKSGLKIALRRIGL